MLTVYPSNTSQLRWQCEEPIVLKQVLKDDGSKGAWTNQGQLEVD